MNRFSGFLLAAAFGVLPLPSSAGQADSGLVVRAVRFYRPDQNRTRVKGLVQIPYAMLQPAGDTAAGRDYRVAVRVSDSTGLTLYQQSWRSSTAAGISVPGAYTVEIVDFAIAPGRYRLDVEVQDSVSGRKAIAGIDLRALSEADGASDLLVAPEMRVATADDTVPRPGEFRTGNSLLTAAARVRLTPLRSKLYYLLEVYTDSAQTGVMAVAIRDSAGATVVRTAEVPVTVDAGGGVLKGQVDLAGLPPGSYAMTAALKLGDRSIERTAGFTMAGLQETLARAAASRAEDRISDAGYFASITPEQLDSAKAPLLYIAEGDELAPWGEGISVEAKRRFLAQFWERRDPTPGTPRNERREQFYAAIEYANRAYREGGRKAVPGWRSDRGRIYARHGAPDDVLRRPNEGLAPDYEVWRYARGKGAFYIFADRTGFGAYQLIYSNDLKEPGIPNWDAILGRRAVGDASQFLGIDLFAEVRRQDMNPGQRF